uniref:Uncharacterized protein n=1 Tax=Coccolithus braarudii TaxID=221442 RepID=A0A7S0LNP5_9EUKA
MTSRSTVRQRGSHTLMAEPQEFTQSTRLREETEAPFGKLRTNFAWPALFAGATIATYFGATSLAAESLGMREAADGTLSGLGIDLGALGTIGFLWRRDIAARDSRLRRISAGARLAALSVRLPKGGTAVRLSDLRTKTAAVGGKRLVIVCAQEAAMMASFEAAAEMIRRLEDAELLVVPLLINPAKTGVPTIEPPTAEIEGLVPALVAPPLGLNAWLDVFGDELGTALGQDPRACERGFTLILKKNGRVGTRRLGLPDWGALADDVAARASAGLDTTNI